MPENDNNDTEIKQHNTKEIEKIFDNLQLDKNMIKDIYRFEKKKDSDFSSANKVTLKQDYRMTVLKASKNLRTKTGFEKVYINRDLTLIERITEKKLIEVKKMMNIVLKKDEPEANYYYGIKNGIIENKKITKP